MTTRRMTAAGLAVLAVFAFGFASVAEAQQETINFAMLAGFKEDVIRAYLPEFEAETGIKVSLDTAPQADLYTKELLSLATGAGRYDVLWIDEPWVPGFAPFLMELDGLLPEVERADFIPSTLAAGQYEGKQYTLPVDPNVHVLVYRRDLFQAAGLQPPRTWPEALAAATRLHDPSQELWGIALTAGSDLQTALYTLLFLWSWGVDVPEADGSVRVNVPAAQEALEFYLDVLEVAPPNVRSYTFADVTATVQSGHAAMGVQWASGMRPLEDPERSAVAGKLGYTVVPGFARVTPMRGVWTVGIARDTRKREAAETFVRWLTSREFGLKAATYPATSSAIHSPRISVLQDPAVVEALPYAPALLENLLVAKERPRIPEWNDIHESLRLIGAQVTTGEVSVQAGLADLEARVRQILGR